MDTVTAGTWAMVMGGTTVAGMVTAITVTEVITGITAAGMVTAVITGAATIMVAITDRTMAGADIIRQATATTTGIIITIGSGSVGGVALHRNQKHCLQVHGAAKDRIYVLP